MASTNRSGFTPTSALAADYQTNGFVFPIDAVSPTSAQEAVDRVESLVASPPNNLKHPWQIKSHLLFRWIYDLTTTPAVLDAVQTIIGPDIMLQAADLFIKPANSHKIINWHQDANYWGLDPFDICTAWIALTDVFPANGCMQFLPNTHMRNKIRHVETYAKNSDLTRGQEIDLNIDENRVVNVSLHAGQISLHHCLLAHASGCNHTDHARIGLAIRYISPKTRQTEGPPMSTILVRGEDNYDHFLTDKPPNGDLNAAAIAAHDRSMSPHAASKYSTA